MEKDNVPATAGPDDNALLDEALSGVKAPIAETIEEIKPETPAPPPEPTVPMPRLREEADARRLAERERDELRRRMDEIFLRQQQPPSPAKRSDLFEAPSAFVQEEVRPLLDPLAEQIRRSNENWSKRFAEQFHGTEKIQAAYSALSEAMHVRRDPEAWRAYNDVIMKSDDPYGEMMRWHTSKEVLTQTKGDLNSYRKAHEEELLDNPEFQKRAFEHWRGKAASTGNVVNRPALVPKIPSIGKVGAAELPSSEEDQSEHQLFQSVTSRRAKE